MLWQLGTWVRGRARGGVDIRVAEAFCTPAVARRAVPVSLRRHRSPQCTLGSCDTGYTDCDLNPNNGCETYTAGDPNNCGCASSRRRPPPSPWLCALDPRLRARSHSPRLHLPGVSLRCAACGHYCANPQYATAGCAGGACDIASCAVGHFDCDHQFMCVVLRRPPAERPQLPDSPRRLSTVHELAAMAVRRRPRAERTRRRPTRARRRPQINP